MIPQCNGRIILAKGKLATIYYDYAPRQGPKDPVLPTLAYTAHWLVCFNHRGMHNSPDAQSKFIGTFIRIKWPSQNMYMNFIAMEFFHAFQIIVYLKIVHKLLKYLFAGNYSKHVFANKKNLKIVHMYWRKIFSTCVLDIIKGQLISKGLFAIHIFFKKTNETIRS